MAIDTPADPEAPTGSDDGAELVDEVADRARERAADADEGRVAQELAASALRRIGVSVGPEAAEVDALADELLALERLIDARQGTAVTVQVRAEGSRMVDGTMAAGSLVQVVSSDRQFIVTSVSALLYRLGFRVVRVLHPVVGVRRSSAGRLLEIVPARDAEHRESVVQLELDTEIAPERVDAVRRAVADVMADVVAATGDHAAIRERVLAVAADLDDPARAGRFDQGERAETAALLRWLLDDNFVLLGCCTFVLGGGGHDDDAAVWVEGGLGILNLPGTPLRQPVPRPATAPLLDMARTAEMSRVHRRVPLHRVDVAVDDATGTATVFRLVGVVSRRAEAESAADIPVLRRKLDDILRLDDVVPGSYDEQTLVSLFQMLPRDELFQIDAAALRDTLNVLLASERDDPVQVQLHPDVASRTVSVLLVLPHDRYSRSLRRRLEQHLATQLDGQEVDAEVSLGHRAEAVVRFLVHVRDGASVPEGPLDDVAHEVRQLCRTWEDRVRQAVRERTDARQAGQLMRALAQRFPAAYRSVTPPEVAAADLEALREVDANPGTVDVRIEPGGPATVPVASCRVCSTGRGIELSAFLPIFESLGLWVVDAAGWTLEGDVLHVHEFTVRLATRLPGLSSIDDVDAALLASAITALASGGDEVDSLNRLVTAAGLDVREVALVRAYRRYRRQVVARYSVERVNDVLVAHPEVVRAFLDWFGLRFDPTAPRDAEAEARSRVYEACDRVASLDADRILRGLAGTLDATVRTNRFARPDGPIALKIDPSKVPDLVAPVPYREVFVIDRRVEGVHVRFGPIARGGIRFSDRPDDYRSEVIDLARTQVLKNAVIVPTGAKGAFVARVPLPADRAARDVAVQALYEDLVTGLLDVTDDLDGDDPYLVVAADKGTATFSDAANELALARGFWLGDAFASGGSRGYDHKALGITARGAWVAVRHHFAELGIDPQTEPITAVGIGDLSGDVFGSGVLRTRELRLVAAFDHRHVFLDPDPDPARSFAERARVAALPTSSWDDYDRSLISAGGGVWRRDEKRIVLGPEAREALRTDAVSLTPPELIQAILRAPVDLLFAGGVGTFVRASVEADETLDDRANSEVRVEAGSLRARVVGEGANLSFTQAARVEFARRGGRINLDAIDNSAGVDTSDHEVNLKVLFAPAVTAGRMGTEERGALLEGAGADVVAAVLADTSLQCEALRRAQAHSADDLPAYVALLGALVGDGTLDPQVDGLPHAQDLDARRAARAGLTRPELAVLLAGAKRRLRARLEHSTLVDEPALRPALASYFPEGLVAAWPDLVDHHRLRRELVAMVVTNDLLDSLGPTAVHAMAASTGATEVEVAAALWAARRVIGAPLRRAFRDVDGTAGEATVMPVPAPPVSAAASEASLVVALARRYLAESIGTDPGPVVTRDAPVFRALAEAMAADGRADGPAVRHRAERLVDAGVSTAEAVRLARAEDLDITPAVAVLAEATGREPAAIFRAFDEVARLLGLADLERSLDIVGSSGRWAAVMRDSLFDDLLALRSGVTERALRARPHLDEVGAVGQWLRERADRLDAVGRLRREAAAAASLDGLEVVVRALKRAVEP